MTDKHQSRQSYAASTERGHFSDGRNTFTVRASASPAPDSFQVSANNNAADLVLIVSGLNSGDMHTTWGPEWRPYAPEWKAWVEDTAFTVLRNGSVRSCDG